MRLHKMLFIVVVNLVGEGIMELKEGQRRTANII